MTLYLIRIIAFWNQHQYMSVKWGNATSTTYTVINGVKQSGILSSLLFNVYNDDLNLTLSKSNIGCRLGGRLINHITYVNDLCILSMSPCRMFLFWCCFKFAYLNHSVLICTVHNDVILLLPLWHWRKIVAQVECLFTMSYLPLPGFGEYKGKLSHILSKALSPVQIVLLWVLVYLLFRCLLSSGATGLILHNDYQNWSTQNIDITLGSEFEDLFIFNLTCKFLNLKMTKHRIQREIVTNRLKDTTRNLTSLAKRKNLKMNSDN